MKTVSFLFVGAATIVLLLVLPLPTNEIPRVWIQQQENKPQVQILFGGDMQFDRYIRQITETVGGDYVFSCIDHVLQTADAVVANLEGPITHYDSVSQGTNIEDDANYVFTFPLSTAQLLARHNIFIVNIGNNHITNFGGEGITETKEALTRADVAYVGAPDDTAPLELDIEGIPFSFINFNEFSSEENVMIYHNITEAREAGRIPIVYTHWGDEYVSVNEKQRALARQFVDAGAALVVGSHPHVVQEVEQYKGTSIYYSLGNFIFDQYFSEEVTRGLLISVVVNENGVASIQEVPIQLHTDGRTCVSDPVER